MIQAYGLSFPDGTTPALTSKELEEVYHSLVESTQPIQYYNGVPVFVLQLGHEISEEERARLQEYLMGELK